LEGFSGVSAKIRQQAADVNKLVLEQAEWLRVRQSGTFERYKSVPAAIKHIGEIAVNPIIQAYIVRDLSSENPGQAIGLGTIIHAQQITHPTADNVNHPDELGVSVYGDDLDYWLQWELRNDSATHRAVGADLLGKSWQLYGEHKKALTGIMGGTGDDANHAMFATILEGDPNPATGLSSLMTKIGDVPVSLTTSMPEDEFEITRGGQLAWLYAIGADNSRRLSLSNGA
jgi:hypothetical protein